MANNIGERTRDTRTSLRSSLRLQGGAWLGCGVRPASGSVAPMIRPGACHRCQGAPQNRPPARKQFLFRAVRSDAWGSSLQSSRVPRGLQEAQGAAALASPGGDQSAPLSQVRGS